MEILLILAPFLIELFKNCNENNNEARATRIKRGGPLVRARLARSLRRSGLRGRKLRRALATTLEDIESASVKEISVLLQEMEEIAAKK